MQKRQPPSISGLIVEETTLTLDEFCSACAVERDWIVVLVNEGILEPIGHKQSQWQFSGISLHRARTAIRLERDLGVNPAGAALVLDLLEEIASLRARLKE